MIKQFETSIEGISIKHSGTEGLLSIKIHLQHMGIFFCRERAHVVVQNLIELITACIDIAQFYPSSLSRYIWNAWLQVPAEVKDRHLLASVKHN